MSQPLSLQRLLAGSGAGLERLVERAHALAELDRRLRRHLPPSLAGHVAVANLRDGVLVLQTSASEWRTRVHFLAPRILEALHTEAPMIKEIRVRVAPIMRQEAPRQPGPRRSAAAADLLQATARSLGDEGLRRALDRLAARLRGG